MSKMVLIMVAVTLMVGSLCQADLVAHLKFNGDLLDSSGNNNHGTATEGITFVEGRYGQAIYTGPAEDYVTLDNEPSFDLTESVTVCAWVKIVGGQGVAWYTVVNKGATGSFRLMTIGPWFSQNGSHGFEIDGCNPHYINADGAVDYPGLLDGAWHFIVGVYDHSAGTFTLYTDGVFNKTTSHSGFPNTNDLPVVIGGGEDSVHINPFDGVIDEVRIYNEALSAADIVGVMNNQEKFKAFGPDPDDWEPDVATNAVLSWSAPLEIPNATYEVYLGTVNDPNLPGVTPVPTGTTTQYDPTPDLSVGTTYFWRVDATDPATSKVHTGDLWRFTTVPPKAYDPSPADEAPDVAQNAVLSWSPAEGGPYTHLLYMGTDPCSLTLEASLPSGTTTYDPQLDWETPYYWQINEDDGVNPVLIGDIWSFTVGIPVCNPPLAADLHRDCVIDLADFSVLAQDWLACTLANGDCP